MWLGFSLSRAGLAAAAALAAVTLAAGIEVARMRLPAELASDAERLQASGYGGKNRGRYELGALGGEFTRIESRFAVLDPLYAANRGKSSFTLHSEDGRESVAAECSFQERVITIGALTFDASKLAYVCEIRHGDSAALGRLTLGEPKPADWKERVAARAARQGIAEIGGVRIDISSVHQYEGSRLSSQIPVGYLLSHETRPVGALELTDSNPTFIFEPGATPEVRRATLIAALAVSVLRDPAASMLDD